MPACTKAPNGLVRRSLRCRLFLLSLFLLITDQGLDDLLEIGPVPAADILDRELDDAQLGILRYSAILQILVILDEPFIQPVPEHIKIADGNIFREENPYPH